MSLLNLEYFIPQTATVSWNRGEKREPFRQLTPSKAIWEIAHRQNFFLKLYCYGGGIDEICGCRRRAIPSGFVFQLFDILLKIRLLVVIWEGECSKISPNVNVPR